MWRRWAHRLIVGMSILGGFFLVLVAGCMFIMGKAFDDMWIEETLDQVASPDGRYIAGVFRRDGGVLTSGETRHVNLRRGSEPFPRSIRGTLDDGLVYLTDKESWGLPIELRWQDPKHLVISAPFGDLHETHWQDVSIRYEALLPWVKLPWVKE